MARRIPLSRRAQLGKAKLRVGGFGLGVRLALFGAVLFPPCAMLAHIGLGQALGRAATAMDIAEAWADHLMQNSVLTEYGWVPSPDSSTAVDASLAEHGAAFILLDPADRVVRASQRLLIPRAALLHFESDGIADAPPLGRVEVTSTVLRVFGEPQGRFLLLASAPATIPLPNMASPVEGDRSRPPPGWPFLLLGAALSGLALFLVGELLVARRLRDLTALAARSLETANRRRRFEVSGADEIEALAKALSVMRRRAQRLVHSLTSRENLRRDWLSQLSHDLRTPLAALHLRLENAGEAADAGQLRAMLRSAIADCERIQTLAAGFMELAKLEVTEDFASEPVMPEELVGQAVRGLRPIAGEAGITVTTAILPQPTIQADGHRLLRALENILRNAIRHARSRVEVGIESDETELRFWVRDDGDGFYELPADVWVDYTDWRGRGQTGGLGLRVADRIARAHGGRLELRNGSDGTTVACVVDVVDPGLDE